MKEKQRDAKIGRKLSPESIAKREATLNKQRDELRSLGLKIRVFSDETKEKMRQARLGRKLSPESIAKREATRKAKREAGLYDK